MYAMVFWFPTMTATKLTTSTSYKLPMAGRNAFRNGSSPASTKVQCSISASSSTLSISRLMVVLAMIYFFFFYSLPQTDCRPADDDTIRTSAAASPLFRKP
jgi:hypothetical protein